MEQPTERPPAQNGLAVRSEPVQKTLGPFAVAERAFGRPIEHKGLHDQSPVFVASSQGPEHRFDFANAAYKRLVGCDDLIGRTVEDALPGLGEQGIVALLDQVFRTGTPFVGSRMAISFKTVSGDTRTRHVSFVYQPVHDEHGQITGLYCEGYDVTAEKLATDQVAALQTEAAYLSRVNAMSMMATTIAHELNQPLTAICNYAAGGLRLVDKSAKHADGLTEALHGIDDAAQRAGEIIGNVRTLMRRGETTRADFNLNMAVAECIRLLNASLCTVVSIKNLVPDGIAALADRVQVQQVIINLLRNAAEAAAPSPRPLVGVNAFRSGDELVVGVSDSGPGLSPQAARDMFEWTGSSKEGGMGLGLSISRTIVEAHGGSLWLEKSDESGSEFRFSIPAGPSATITAAHA